MKTFRYSLFPSMITDHQYSYTNSPRRRYPTNIEYNTERSRYTYASVVSPPVFGTQSSSRRRLNIYTHRGRYAIILLQECRLCKYTRGHDRWQQRWRRKRKAARRDCSKCRCRREERRGRSGETTRDDLYRCTLKCPHHADDRRPEVFSSFHFHIINY